MNIIIILLIFSMCLCCRCPEETVKIPIIIEEEIIEVLESIDDGNCG